MFGVTDPGASPSLLGRVRASRARVRASWAGVRVSWAGVRVSTDSASPGGTCTPLLVTLSPISANQQVAT
jgi:hypothetical protein